MLSINTIGVIGGDDADDCAEVLSASAQSCGLSVRRAQLHEGSHLTGLILLGSVSEQPGTQALQDRPSIRVILSDTTAATATVCFGTGSASPLPFRGRVVLTGSAVPCVSRDVSGEVIACTDGKPLWTTTSVGGLRHDTCWVGRPWIKKGDCVFEHLNGNRFMNLLPLLEWLRWISDWRKWEQPPLRACFMFDDPNLHSTRYGFVKFDELAAEGMRNRYHTSFATVPLDGYYVNRDAARLLRDNVNTLSLLVHGNNHTRQELAGRQAPGVQMALMQQALLRIGRLEQKAGIAVSRVMAPPHGVCSVEMMTAMMDAGFEAACISHGSVWTANPGVRWTVSLGASPATLVGGFPVIPRIGLNRTAENNVLLAAYLNQPIILVGHHWDLADGTDILSSVAQFVNGLGFVVWSDMASIARSNYRFRLHDQVMSVHTFSRITTVAVPEGISQLRLEAPWLDSAMEIIECRSSNRTARRPLRAAPSEATCFCVTPGSKVALVVERTLSSREQPDTLPSTSLSAISRRVLVHIRDRSMPYLPRKWIKQLLAKPAGVSVAIPNTKQSQLHTH